MTPQIVLHTALAAGGFSCAAFVAGDAAFSAFPLLMQRLVDWLGGERSGSPFAADA